MRINKKSLIKEEKLYLNKYRLPYEIAEVETAMVNKYGCVRIENNFYSVPDYLLKHIVTVKKYHDKIMIFSNNEFVCEHKKIDGSGEYQLMLSHYIKTLTTKPGALRNSLVLKQQPDLYNIYHLHFKSRPKEFIALIQNNQQKSVDDLIEILKDNGSATEEIRTNRHDIIEDASRTQLISLNQFMN